MKVTLQSTITPVELIVRPDRQDYIVEDAATKEYYEMTELCVEALKRMSEGKTLDAIQSELVSRYPGEEVDLLGFAEQLLELRLVAELDGNVLRTEKAEEGEAASRKRDSFGWISPSLAKLWFHPVLRWLYVLAIAAIVGLLAAKPELFPRYGDVFLFDSMVANSLLWLGLSFVLLMLHEFGHIVAIRSFGLPAKLGIGHRFVFVVFETEMDDVWRLTPKQRNRAFLAGMGVDLLMLLLCLIVQAAAPGDPGFAQRLAAFAALDLVVKLAFQCCFYMKTDLYYVVENATGCYNLMERSRSLIQGKLRRRNGGEAGGAEEPRAVRWYSVFYVAGYALNIVLIVFVFAPQLIVSLTTVLPWLAVPGETGRFWDAVVFVAEIAGLGALLLYAWRKSKRAATGG